MITIFLLFQLVAGQLHEVDAFVFSAQCEEAKAQLDAIIVQARKARPELPAITTFCKPVQVNPTNV